MIKVEVGPGEEVLSTVEAACYTRGVVNGSIVLIGAVDTFTISVMLATRARTDIERQYTQPAELSGTGEVVNGKVHIHANLAIEGHGVVGGHLISAVVTTFFVHAYVTPLDSEWQPGVSGSYGA